MFSGPTPNQCRYKTEVGTLWAPGGDFMIMDSPDSGATWSKPRVRAHQTAPALTIHHTGLPQTHTPVGTRAPPESVLGACTRSYGNFTTLPPCGQKMYKCIF